MKTLVTLALLLSACSQADTPKPVDTVPTPEIQKPAPTSSPAPQKKPDDKAKKTKHADKKKDPPKEKPSKT